MSDGTIKEVTHNTAEDKSAPKPLGRRVLRGLAPDVIGAAYVLIGLVILFSIVAPDTFPSWFTVRQVLSTNAVSALAALSLVVPFAAGVFDVSIPYTMTLSGVICTGAIVSSGTSVLVGVVFGILSGVVVGIVNAIVIVGGNVDSLIATLGTGFLIQAVVQWRTNGSTITGSQLTGTFSDISQRNWLFNLPYPVYYALALAVIVWILLSHSLVGRRTYATGFNQQAARLAGVKTARVRTLAIILASTFAGITGVVLASTLESGSPTAGTQYLLPAFATVFLGATQIQPGRFNSWGTVLGVVLLGTLTTGMGLAGAPEWLQQFATGVVLLVALALTGFVARKGGTSQRGWL